MQDNILNLRMQINDSFEFSETQKTAEAVMCSHSNQTTIYQN